MRFAKQRLLAEAGLVELPEELLSGIQVQALTGRMSPPLWGTHSIQRRVAIPVGPTIKDPETGEPNQMKMHGSVLSLSPIVRLGYSDALPLPAVQHLLENPNAQMANVSFGWDGDWGYSGPRGQGAMEAAKVGYRDLLRKAYEDLASQLNLKPGDMLSNSPNGARIGDYKRAMSYMNYGNYGPLDLDYSMTAAISPTGQMVPMLMDPVSKRFAERLGWRPGDVQALPNEMAQEIQKIAQQKVAANRGSLSGGGKGRSQGAPATGSRRASDERPPDRYYEDASWQDLYPIQEEGLLGNNRNSDLQEEGLLRNQPLDNSSRETTGLTPVQGRTMDLMRRYGWSGGAEVNDIERWNGLLREAMRSEGARYPNELGDSRLREITEDAGVARAFEIIERLEGARRNIRRSTSQIDF